MVYEMTVSANTDSDVQPVIAALESPMVVEIYGVDYDRLRVTLAEGSDFAAFESSLDGDVDVKSYERMQHGQFAEVTNAR